MSWHAVLIVLIVLAVFVVPAMLGGALARRLRMPDYGWKFGVIFFALLASLVVTTAGWPPKLGIDLSGGVFLVYEIDRKDLSSEEMDKLIRAVSMRVNPSGLKEITIRPYGVGQIEIIIPEEGEEEANRVAEIISRAGTLEFRIVANGRDHGPLIEQAKQDKIPDVVDAEGKKRKAAWWVPMFEGRGTDDDKKRIQGLVASSDGNRTVKQGDKEVVEVLVVNDLFDVTGTYLTQARADTDQEGQECVNFQFNSEGAQRFGGLTGSNLPEQGQQFSRKLGIILDHALYSAPNIKSTITDRGEISGSFSKEEVDDLVNVLNAGSLPTALKKEPISRLISGPTLGRDTIYKGTLAMIISAILVPLFMVWYYRFSGVVANIALALNMLVLVAMMIALSARFTLTGLAGLALTIGMAVDNNVLLYERLREELERGATLRMAIRNAFHRAGAVIIDTNSTHMIASTVLYVIGSEQVKGFAVILWLGAAISLFTAVFVARVIFEVAERQKWLTKAKMLKLIGHTDIDFMGWFPVTATLSLVVTLGGLMVAGVRGQGLFDIDFTGGVSVETLFREPQDTGKVRKLLSDMPELPDLAISDVQIRGEPQGKRFLINTSQPTFEVVENKLNEVFGGELVRNSVAVEAKPIQPAAQTRPNSAPAKAAPAEENASPKGKGAAEGLPAPDKNDQGRRALPPNSMLAMATLEGDSPTFAARKSGQSPSVLAMAGGAPLALAQAEKPGEKADAEEEPAAPSEKKPAEKPADEPAEKPGMEKPSTEAPADNPAEKPAEKPSEEPTEKPAEKPTEKPAEMPTEEPAEKLPEQPETEKPAEQQPAPAIESTFAGGTQARLTFQLDVNHRSVALMVSKAIKTAQNVDPESVALQLSNDLYTTGDEKAYPWWDLKIAMPPEKANAVLQTLQEQVKEKPYFPASVEIGSAVAAGTRTQAFYAVFASWLLIILYLWVRFQKVAFGVAAVIALVHDVLVMLGAIAISYYIAPIFGWLQIEPFKVNLPIVAAFLTIIGYSVNDTIVIFDRIREVRGKDPNLTRKMVNDSTNQTLSRTLLTSFTVLLVVVVLYFFGGDALHGFAFALLVGVLTGTYSSIYVAAPILLWLIHPPKLRAER